MKKSVANCKQLNTVEMYLRIACLIIRSSPPLKISRQWLFVLLVVVDWRQGWYLDTEEGKVMEEYCWVRRTLDRTGRNGVTARVGVFVLST
jgi:hypothetical protein